MRTRPTHDYLRKLDLELRDSRQKCQKAGSGTLNSCSQPPTFVVPRITNLQHSSLRLIGEFLAYGFIRLSSLLYLGIQTSNFS